jgi:hypothetical protein
MGIQGDAATSRWVWVVDDVASSVAHRWRSCTVAAEVVVVVYTVILVSLARGWYAPLESSSGGEWWW